MAVIPAPDEVPVAEAPVDRSMVMVETLDASVVFSYIKSARIKYTAVAASRRYELALAPLPCIRDGLITMPH